MLTVLKLLGFLCCVLLHSHPSRASLHPLLRFVPLASHMTRTLVKTQFVRLKNRVLRYWDIIINVIYPSAISKLMTPPLPLQFAEQFKEVKEAARLAREKSQERFELANPGLNIAAPEVKF